MVLHALYDIPLLGLRNANIGSAATRAAWEQMALIVGFGTVAIAVRLTLRIAGSQKAWSRTSRTPVAAWRRIWGWLVLGAGTGYAGAVLLVSAVRQGAAGDPSALSLWAQEPPWWSSRLSSVARAESIWLTLPSRGGLHAADAQHLNRRHSYHHRSTRLSEVYCTGASHTRFARLRDGGLPGQ